MRMSQGALYEELKSRGLSVAGSRWVLATRLAVHEDLSILKSCKVMKETVQKELLPAVPQLCEVGVLAAPEAFDRGVLIGKPTAGSCGDA